MIGAADLMHATRWPYAFTADGWLFENKLDGFRALVRKQDSTAELISRNGRAMTAQFPDVAEALAGLPTCILERSSSYWTPAGTQSGIAYAHGL